MAQRPKDLISKLADAGEEAIQKVTDTVTDIPGATKLGQSVNTMKERLDDVTKKMRGLEAMEKRIAKLEKQLDQLQGKKTTSTTRAVAKTTSGGSRKKASSSSTRKSSSSSRTKKR